MKKYYGCKLSKTDKRYKKYKKQRKVRGFDDTETWSLDASLAKFLVPRLKRFKKINNGFPYGQNKESWDDIIDMMTVGFKLMAECRGVYEKEEIALMRRSTLLLARHIRNLWW